MPSKNIDATRQSLTDSPEYLDDGNRYPRAIELTEKALKLTLTPKDKAFAYFLLADLYNRTGDAARSKQFAQRGAAIGS